MAASTTIYTKNGYVKTAAYFNYAKKRGISADKLEIAVNKYLQTGDVLNYEKIKGAVKSKVPLIIDNYYDSATSMSTQDVRESLREEIYPMEWARNPDILQFQGELEWETGSSIPSVPSVPSETSGTFDNKSRGVVLVLVIIIVLAILIITGMVNVFGNIKGRFAGMPTTSPWNKKYLVAY